MVLSQISWQNSSAQDEDCQGEHSQEYIAGRVHFHIYNVSETSTTYNVEVGQHNIGEPILPNGCIQGVFNPFAWNKPIALTCVDYPTGSSQDNYLVMADLENMKTHSPRCDTGQQ